MSLEESDSTLKDLGFEDSENIRFEKLSVTFEVDFEDTNFLDVDLGVTLNLQDVQTQPLISVPRHQDFAYFTLAMVDPNAPSRENPVAKVGFMTLRFSLKKLMLTD